MSEVVLNARKGRDTGKGPARRSRREGLLPGVVYGLGGEAVAVSVIERDLQHILAKGTGRNTLISLDVDGDRQLVLAREVQRHPVRQALLHVDFVRVSRDVAVSAEVPVHLIGEATGVKDGGLLDQVLFNLTVEAKPADIPAVIEVDISALTIGDHLLVSGLALPAGVVATQEPGALVAQVTAPRGLTVEEAAAEEAAAEVAAALAPAASQAGGGGEG